MSHQKHTIPELLLPAGNPAKLNSALLYGADAVYLGGSALNLRAAAQGFTGPELKQAVHNAEKSNAKVYYCLNSLPMQEDLKTLPAQIEEAADCGAHAFIIADPGVLRLAKRHAPKIPVHLSTQANSTNSEAVKFWLDQGVQRINLARELNRDAIAALRADAPEAELEVFVQGAMCLAVSGQCLLSAWLNRRPANSGRCTQPCRFEYKALAAENFSEKNTSALLHVEERTRPGAEIWAVQQDEAYSSFWAPDDLCLLPWLPWFMQQGIASVKVEGRTKSSAYVAHMADVYATALRGLKAGVTENYNYIAALSELMHVSARPLSSGFFLPGEKRLLNNESAAQASFTPHKVVAVILQQNAPGEWEIEVKDNWAEQDTAELMLPGMLRPALPPGSYALRNHKDENCGKVACGTKATLLCAHQGLAPGLFIRKVPHTAAPA